MKHSEVFTDAFIVSLRVHRNQLMMRWTGLALDLDAHTLSVVGTQNRWYTFADFHFG